VPEELTDKFRNDPRFTDRRHRRYYSLTPADSIAAARADPPGLYTSIWHGLWVPKGMPRDIIAKLNGAVVDALADARVRQRLAQLPEALDALQHNEIDKWWPIIKAAHIQDQRISRLLEGTPARHANGLI
jgi:hypothetical protein